MFKNSLGELVARETCIFPLITFDPMKKLYTCLGTGFFIHPFGGFVTAKHVFFDNDGQHRPTLYGIQSLADGKRVMRTLKHLAVHETADVAIGMLGDAKNNNEFNRSPPAASSFILSFGELNEGDQVSTYAFPNTTSEWTEDGAQEFTFQGTWQEGVVEAYHPEGLGLVRNPCYQTTMRVDGGASGGPVLKGATVYAVNSSGMDFMDGDTMSCVTPVNLLKDLRLPGSNGPLSVQQLAERGYIVVR